MHKDELCPCGFHPSINEDQFETSCSEFGMLDKVLFREWTSTCKQCNQNFTCKVDLEPETIKTVFGGAR